MDLVRINIEADELYPVLVVTTENVGDEWFNEKEAVFVPIKLVNVWKEGIQAVTKAERAILGYILAHEDKDSEVYKTAKFLNEN